VTCSETSCDHSHPRHHAAVVAAAVAVVAAVVDADVHVTVRGEDRTLQAEAAQSSYRCRWHRSQLCLR